MHFTVWAILVVGTAIFGLSVVGLLTVPRRLESWCILSGALGLALAGWGSYAIVTSYARVDIALYAILFGVAGAVGGYGLGSSLLSSVTHRPNRITLPANPSEPRPGTVVLLISCAEPEVYDPRTTTAVLEEITEVESPQNSIGLTPFPYAAQKARYRAVGGKSPATREYQAIVSAIRERLDPEEYPVVDAVQCKASRNLSQAMIEAANTGLRKFIIVGLSVAETYHIDRAKCAVDALHTELLGLQVAYAPPLWASDDLAALVARRVLGCTENPEVTGVALVTHGQPPLRSKSHPVFDAQEQSFVNRVRSLLLDGGLEEHLIRSAWSNWRDPDVTETVRHLAALGAEKILVCPACDPLDTVSTMLDLPLAAKQARVDPPARVVQMGAWGDEAAVADAVVATIKETECELEAV